MEESSAPVVPSTRNDRLTTVEADATEPSEIDAASTVETATQSDASLQQLLNCTNAIDTKLAQISASFQSRLSYDGAKEKAFDRLYAELDQLKSNTEFDHLRPLYLDLILLYDRIENICASGEDVSREDSGVSTLLQSLREELVEILYRREVEVIRPSPLTFDPATQRAIGIEPALSESENGRVARVVRKGFVYRNRIIRAEEVIVKKCTASTPQESSSSERVTHD